MEKTKDRLKRLKKRFGRNRSPPPSPIASTSSLSDSVPRPASTVHVPLSAPTTINDTYDGFKTILRQVRDSAGVSGLKLATGYLISLVEALQYLPKDKDNTLIEDKLSTIVSMIDNNADVGAAKSIEKLSESLLSDVLRVRTSLSSARTVNTTPDGDVDEFSAYKHVNELLDAFLVDIARSVEANNNNSGQNVYDWAALQHESGLRLLSLDGGQTDVLGSLSQLLILREIMRRLEHDLNQTNMRPSDWFDMMGGSGTGGLIAIMLGRLHMTVDQAIKAYVGIFSSYFSDAKSKLSREDDRTKQLESDLEKMIASCGLLDGSNQRLMDNESGVCKVFVCALDPTNLEFPILFRSYRARSHSSYNCSVKEAARAATAIIGEYGPVTIGDEIKQEYVSASHCYNNPTEYLLKEAKEFFRDRSVSCVVSIGTGHPGVTQIQSSDDLAQAALRFARNSERVSEAVFRRLGDIPSLFYRLNVEQGLQWELLHNSSKAASKVQAHTRSYLTRTDKKVDDLVESLRNCEAKISASDLGGTTLFVEQKDAAEIRETTSKHYLKSLLKELQPVEQAIYNATSPIPRRACTKNTREEILDTFVLWALDKEDRKIYYLNGMAGTGKTTLAYTLSQLLEKMGLLGGTFFCSRADHSCSDANRITSTLAFQLARYSPIICRELVHVLEKNAGQPGHNVDLRFDNFIVKPLKAAAKSMNKPIIVVIDALDECRSDSHVLMLMHNLWSYASDLPIKFFVTSRPERPFHDKIYGLDELSTKFHLHNVEASLVGRDIRLFLEERLQDLAHDYRIRGLPVSSDWPPKNQLSALTEQSGKLFIYAATACQYIGGSKLNLSERLERVVNIGIKASKAQTDPLDSLYTGVLEDAYKGCEEPERRTMNEILGAVISSIAPLSVSALSELLRIDHPNVIAGLSLFHSVLNVPVDSSLVTTLHASFPDYLSDETRSLQFHLSSTGNHYLLASFSLELMENKLCENICNQEGYPDNESIPKALLEQCISPALGYACSHWSTHARLSCDYKTIDSSLKSKITNFFDSQSLMWIECLSYINALYHSIYLLRVFEGWISKENVDLASRILDTRRFISQNIEMLSVNGLETYSSAMVWLPRTSYICQTFGLRRRLPRVVAGLQLGWDPCEMIITGHSGAVLSAAFSPDSDGARIASGSRDGNVWMWDSTTGKSEWNSMGHSSAVLSVVFSSDGNQIASGSDDKTMRIWNTTTGKSEHRLTSYSQDSDGVMSVAISPDSSRIASSSYDRTIQIWSTITGKLEHKFSGHSRAILSLAFSPDNSRIASGSYDRTVRIWHLNAASYKTEHELKGHSGSVESVAISPFGTRVVSGSDDLTVRLWNIITGELEYTLAGHSGSVRSVAFSSDSARIVSGSRDRTVRIWSVTSGASEHEFTGHTGSVETVAFSPDGSRITSGSDDKTVRIWNASSERGRSHSVESAVFSTDRAHNPWDRTLQIWKAITGKTDRKLTGHSDAIMSIAFTSNGARIVSGSVDRTMRIWNSKTGELERELTGHLSAVMSVAFSYDGARVASGAEDGTVWIWNTETGKAEDQMDRHHGAALSVSFSPDGAYIVSGSRDRSVRIWDPKTRIVGTLTGHSASVESVAISPDGSWLASSSADNIVRIWNMSTCHLWHELTDHSDDVISIAFSPDSTQISAQSRNGLILVWNVLSGELEQNPTEDPESIPTTVFSQTSSLLHLSKDSRWLALSGTSRKYWIPPEYAKFTRQCFHSNKAVFGYDTGRLVILKVHRK